MKQILRRALLLPLFALAGTAGFAAIPVDSSHESATLSLGKVDFVRRWSKGEQHEFTPQGQEDLEHWSDMVTINYYRNVRDGAALAATANAVLENYKANRARVVKTDSVARTPNKPAEHLVVVMFGTPAYIEVAFARFRMVDGIGLSVIYCHREYGANVGTQAGAWLEKNGPASETALMAMKTIPMLKQSGTPE